MAQRLGWKPGNALPSFHQLEWAGWVTSYTRAILYVAMAEAGDDLIGVETDAVFTTKTLPNLVVGAGLGEWEIAEHAYITYLQNGTYWTDKVAKYRGFDADSLNHSDALAWLQRGNFDVPLVGTTTRFIGAGRGLGTPLHRVWLKESRDVRPGRTGKRMHVPEACIACVDGHSPAERLHSLICVDRGGESTPHHLPWIDHGGLTGTDEFASWDDLAELTSWDDLLGRTV